MWQLWRGHLTFMRRLPQMFAIEPRPIDLPHRMFPAAGDLENGASRGNGGAQVCSWRQSKL